jgi:hypothetical protein
MSMRRNFLQNKNEKEHKPLGHLNHLTPLNISWILEVLDSSMSNHQKLLCVHPACTKKALTLQWHTYLQFIPTLQLALVNSLLQSTHIVPARLYLYEQLLHHGILKKVLSPLVLNGTHNTCILHSWYQIKTWNHHHHHHQQFCLNALA